MQIENTSILEGSTSILIDVTQTPNIFQNGPGITTEIGKLESPTFLYSPNQLVLDGLGSALPRDASLPGSANFVRVRSHDGAPSAASQAPQLSSAVESQNFHWSVEVPPELHSSWDDRSHHLRPAGGGPSSASAQHVRPDAYSNLNLIPDRTLKRKSPSFAFNRATTELPQGLQSQQTNASNADMSSFQPSVEDGICKMISLARSLGFESLDSMMLQYYTHSFEENASAVEVQGRSRRRGLPALLSHLSRAARGWPRREAQGFEEALLASVEHIVRREADSYAGARTSEARFKDVAPPENRASNVKSLRTDVGFVACV